MHENWGTFVNPFSTGTWFPRIMNGVLEKVCAQFSSKLEHGTWSLCFITQLFRFIEKPYYKAYILFPLFCPNCALGAFILKDTKCLYQTPWRGSGRWPWTWTLVCHLPPKQEASWEADLKLNMSRNAMLLACTYTVLKGLVYFVLRFCCVWQGRQCPAQ